MCIVTKATHLKRSLAAMQRNAPATTTTPTMSAAAQRLLVLKGSHTMSTDKPEPVWNLYEFDEPQQIASATFIDDETGVLRLR